MDRVYPDTNRFRQIVRGKIRENLKQYIKQGELIGRQGKNVVSIPLPQIEIPRFVYGRQQSGGVGQGPGGAGDYCQCDACPWRQKVLNMDLIFGIDGKGMR